MPDRKLSRLLSIFLIKTEVREPDEIFRELSNLDHRSIRVDAERIGDLYWRRSMVRSPRWVSLFRGVPLTISWTRLLPYSSRLPGRIAWGSSLLRQLSAVSICDHSVILQFV